MRSAQADRAGISSPERGRDQGTDRQDQRNEAEIKELAAKIGENEAEIKERIAKIKEMEASEGPNGRSYEILYKLWQAERATEQDDRMAICNKARQLINELAGIRPGLPQIPYSLAKIDELEAARPELSTDDRKAKLYEAAMHYRRALELGQRDLETIRRVTDLLYYSGHANEVVQLWNQLASTASFGLREQVTLALFGIAISTWRSNWHAKAKQPTPRTCSSEFSSCRFLWPRAAATRRRSSFAMPCARLLANIYGGCS